MLVITLLASLCQGCFVLEEIDKGQAIMDQHSPRAREAKEQQKKAEAAPRTARAAQQQEEGTLESLQSWWKKMREPAPPGRDPDDVVVRCRIGGSVQFTRKSDCALRGGRAS